MKYCAFGLFVIFFSISLFSCYSIKDITSDNIIKKIENDFAYYEADSVRVFFAPSFYWGYSTSSKREANQIYRNYIKTYGIIFEKKLLTGKSFYCGLYNDCSLPKNTYNAILNLSDRDKLSLNLYGYDGPIVKIFSIEDITGNSDYSSSKRVFEIYATTSKFENGWGMADIYHLQLTNDKPGERKTLREFIKSAKVTYFQYTGSEI